MASLFAPQLIAARAGVPMTSTVGPQTLILVGALISGLIGLALPLSILQVYDRITKTDATATLDALALILVSLFVLDYMVRNAVTDLRGAASTRFATDLTREALARLLHAPSGELAEPQSQTEERLLGIGRLASHFASSARQTAVEIPFALLYLAAVGIIGGIVVLVPIAMVLIFGSITMIRGRRLRHALDQRRQSGIAWTGHWQAIFRAVASIKALGMERLMLRRSEPLRSASQRLEQLITELGERTRATAGSLGSSITLTVVSAGAILAADQGLSVGQVAACSLLSGRAVQPIIRLASSWGEHQLFRVTLGSVAGLFTLPEAPDQRATPEVPPDIALTIDGETECIGVSPGGVLHVSGGDLARRRAFIDVLIGRRPVKDPGMVIDAMTPRHYRWTYADAVSVIGREIVPYSGTVRDNLTGFGRRTRLDAALAIIDRLHISEELNSTPHGLETRLETANDLPPQLVQGIALARILGSEPALLVLDDPIDALDPMIYVALIAELQTLRGRSTLVFVGPDLPPGLEADAEVYLGTETDASR
ncbi:MAG: ABC transporter transmembrane domain-containing protein [Pseudomonadota bacterium]